MSLAKFLLFCTLFQLLRSSQARPVDSSLQQLHCAVRSLLTSGKIRFNCGEGYKSDCSTCSYSRECLSYSCYKNKCVRRSSDYSKCLLKPKPVCSKCSSGKECLSGKCWGSPGKCTTVGDYNELVRCGFKKECETCSNSLQCATKKCWGPGGGAPLKCTYDTSSSKSKCYPSSSSSKKPDCSACKSSSECLSGRKCWGSPARCVLSSSTYEHLRKCGYKKHCQYCTSGLQCATKICHNNLCTRSYSDKTCRLDLPNPDPFPGDPCYIKYRGPDRVLEACH